MKILTNSEIKVISGGADKACVSVVKNYDKEMECQNLEIIIKNGNDETKIGSFADGQYTPERAEEILKQLKLIKSELAELGKVTVRKIPA